MRPPFRFHLSLCIFILFSIFCLREDVSMNQSYVFFHKIDAIIFKKLLFIGVFFLCA